MAAMTHDLITTLREIEEIDCREVGMLILPDTFAHPGFWAAITALAHERNYNTEQIEFGNDSLRSYSNTLGLECALTGNTQHEPNRPNAGNTYSPIVKLDCADASNAATSTINSCLRNFSRTNNQTDGFKQLLHVVGEMHSNVWDHGLSTGFSIAQKTIVPYSSPTDHYFEFALADRGKGFLRDMQQHAKPANNHQEAIQWCIQEGHTTKNSEERDHFAQRIPTYHAGGNPFGPGTPTFVSDGTENHHQGLGLAKLVQLVIDFSGELCLASGDSALLIDADGNRSYSNLPSEWRGVALSCRLRASNLERRQQRQHDDLEPILRLLRGE